MVIQLLFSSSLACLQRISFGAAQERKYIRAAVTPYSKVEPKQGQTVYSAASLKISAAKPAPSVKNIVLSGDTAFGSVMNVQYNYVKAEDGDEEGATRVIWEAADFPAGAFTQIGEGNSFSISTSVAGKYLRVSITPDDDVTAERVSGKTSAAFYPKEQATRAECTSLVKRLLEQ